MLKHRLPLLIAISACLVAALPAQAKASPSPAPAKPAAASDKEGGSVSIEELYLSQDVEVQVLRSQVMSNNRETKVMALQNIGAMVDDKRVTADNKEVVALLESLAGEGVFKLARQEGSVSNYYPDVRRQAVELLGKIGGKDAKTILMRVTQADKEPMVLAEAVYAMGKLAGDDDKDVLPYITKVMQVNNTRVSPDNNLAFACLLTVERLAGKFKGGVADPELINALLETATGLYLKDVRYKAIAVISKLRGSK